MQLREPRVCAVVLAAVVSFSVRVATATVSIDWVTVGNPGNAPDPATGNQYGAVSYTYQISKHEVTNAQYAEFLNAKAPSNSLGLYEPSMDTSIHGGITLSGSEGNYSYSVKSGYANKPVVFIQWYDAIRFANWLHNGQGTGDTETGAYTLLGGTPTPSNGSSITRNPGAQIFLTSENEWYKAAFYQPAAAGGDIDNYWSFPTTTNIDPHSDQPPGDPLIAGNVANYYRDDSLSNGYDDGYAVTASTASGDGRLTDVGAYANSPSFYDTFDQGGNVYEWNESVYLGTQRGIRGGSWANANPDALRSDGVFAGTPGGATDASMGYRVASIPEPASGGVLLMLGGLTLGNRSRRESRLAAV